MRKLLYLLLTVLIVACSGEDGGDNQDNNDGDTNGDSNDTTCEYVLNTLAVTNIGENIATLNGMISNDSSCEFPITEQGFVYATNIQPTIASAKVNVNGTVVTTTLENLEPNTTYYVRTFLTNALGEFYGNEVSFVTTEEEEEPEQPINCNGNQVPSVVYGTQEWTVENACYITYSDGTPIPEVTDATEWSNLTTGAWCYYNNDPTKPILYNWYAVMGIQDANPNTPNKKLEPDGWHLPSDQEWITLQQYLIANGYNYIDNNTTQNLIAKAMASTTGWSSSTQDGAVGNDQSSNNSSGFNAFPEGYRSDSGLYGNEGELAIFWSSQEYDGPHAWIRYLTNTGNKLTRTWLLQKHGFSVRFVRD